MWTHRVFLSLTSLALPLSAAHAEEEVTLEENAIEASRPKSINFQPFPALAGSLSLNYAQLLDGYHGFLIEGALVNSTIEPTDPEEPKITTKGFDLLVGYRYHWSGGQNSGFWGVSAGHSRGTSSRDNGSNISYKNTTLTLNLGRRWAWENGFNITFRAGLGFGDYNFKSDGDTEEQLGIAALNELPIGLEGEFSLGYCF
ncbi:MAG: hypothetical protein VYD19_00530 [Myxococcota bacterium]|nr:hypothetical protein [Myxococcota bacterium]